MALTAPSGLTATANSTTAWQIDLAWTNNDNYDELSVLYRYGGGVFTTLASIDNTDTSYSHEDVTPNVTYEYRIQADKTDPPEEAETVYSNTDSCTCWGDVRTTTLNLSGSSTEYITGVDSSDTVTGTIEFSGYSLSAQTLTINFEYYLGDSEGNIYLYSDAYKSDGGTAIPSYWQSKTTNFTDQFPELENRYKNVHFARLYYVDTDSSVATSIKLSTDGGATWTATSTQSIGTGDGKNKSEDFYFEGGAVAGQFITARVESATTDAQLQWTALALYFDVGGEDFSLT